MALAERLNGGEGVVSTGDEEDLVGGPSTSNFSAGSLARDWACSDAFSSETSSGSTAVSAGEFSRLSSVSTASESTRVLPPAPEEVMEGDLSRWFVVRMGALKRSGNDEGDSGKDTWFVGSTLASRSASTGGEGGESSEGGELGSVVDSESLALRARFVRRFCFVF